VSAIGLHHFLFVGAALFALGLVTVLSRRNAVGLLMGVELLLNAANVNLVAFNRYANPSNHDGQVFALFVIVLAACEAAVGLAIVLTVYRTFRSIDTQDTSLLRN
jgi:NADH-quinone oxidoreductase subunit K